MSHPFHRFLFLISINLLILICDCRNINICAGRNIEGGITAKDIHSGIFIDINDGSFDNGVVIDSGGAECEVPLDELDTTLGSVIELSYAKESVRDVAGCFEIKSNKIPQIPRGFQLFDCKVTSTTRKILTYENIEELAIASISQVRDNGEDLRSKLGANSRVFIRNVPKEVTPVVQHVVGRVDVECEYPNPFVTPSLFRSSDDSISGDEDLTANLTGRRYSREVGGEDEDALKSAAGRYSCSWEQKPADGAMMRYSSQFQVNAYAEQINCSVENDVGVNLQKDVLINTMVENVPVVCSLNWAGTAGQAVSLKWSKSIDDGSFVSVVNGGLKKSASFAFTGNVTEPITFVCQVDNATIFQGGVTPNSCRVTINPVDSLPGEKDGRFGLDHHSSRHSRMTKLLLDSWNKSM